MRKPQENPERRYRRAEAARFPHNKKTEMDYKKIKASHEAITRDLSDFDKETGNIYETVVNLAKRANQISSALRQELVNKISEFASQSAAADGIDEIYENREQIEIARYYEQLPKPTLIATQELLDGSLCFRRPVKEDSLEQIL